MSQPDQDPRREAEVKAFLKDIFHVRFPDPEADPFLPAHATLTRQNQPEFYADAPWRLEPDVEGLPLLFVIREANVQDPGKGPWRLEELRVEEQRASGTWHAVRTYRPAQLPGVDGEGSIKEGYWSHAARIPLAALQSVSPGERGVVLRLRVVFQGRFPPYDEPHVSPERYLQVMLAAHALPLGRAASQGQPRRWFYGDTHYHSAYTNDVWEFGNPVRDARLAGQALGLDWLVVTDHSCDLDDKDPGDGDLSRWQRLRYDLRKTSISNKSFRVLAGEEVTLWNAIGGYVHLLVMGPLRNMVPGGFWSEDDVAIKWLAASVNKLIASDGGYPPDAIRRLFGPVLDLEEVLARLPPGVLAFAAHPYDPAQPPFFNSTWTKDELDTRRLTGFEFWNGRSRRQTRPILDVTDDPFAAAGWTDPGELAKRDAARAKQLRERVEDKWEAALCQGVDAWSEDEPLPGFRPVFIGGSDAHGDFNYSVGVGWNYKEHAWITDNALGRVRTAVCLPDHNLSSVPTQPAILAALRRGACVVTDGPVLECSLHQNGQAAGLGDLAQLTSGAAARLLVTGHTSPDFGPVSEIEVTTYLQGQKEKEPRRTVVRAPDHETIELDGRRGYCRVQCWTTGSDGEPFCCFTNPIWLDLPGGGPVHLEVRLQS